MKPSSAINETIAYWKKQNGWFGREPATSVLRAIKQARAEGKLDDVEGQLARIRIYCENSLNIRIA